jgi:hypothetical protein
MAIHIIIVDVPNNNKGGFNNQSDCYSGLQLTNQKKQYYGIVVNVIRNQDKEYIIGIVESDTHQGLYDKVNNTDGYIHQVSEVHYKTNEITYGGINRYYTVDHTIYIGSIINYGW